MGVKLGRSHWGRNVGWGCLRRIFGSKRDEVTREWRKLHNGDLNDLYSSPRIFRVIKSRRIRWAGYEARMGKRWGAYRVLEEKPEGKRLLRRRRRWWEDNIKMHLQEVGCGGLNWIDLALDRERCLALVNAVVKLRVPKIRGISRLAENPLASQEGLCSMHRLTLRLLMSYIYGAPIRDVSRSHTTTHYSR